jgi:hypothetical protein
MKPNPEMDNFDAGMAKLLKVNPQIVRVAMEKEKQDREAERKAKRSASSSARVSSSRDA